MTCKYEVCESGIDGLHSLRLLMIFVLLQRVRVQIYNTVSNIKTYNMRDLRYNLHVLHTAFPQTNFSE